MTKEFAEKVLRDRIVDTKTYRYIVRECHDSDSQWAEIRRIRLSALDTTSAIDSWETVKVVRCHV